MVATVPLAVVILVGKTKILDQQKYISRLNGDLHSFQSGQSFIWQGPCP